MKKIMFVIGGLANGGAERVVTSIASELAERDYEVSILTYYKSDNEYHYSPKINRINISNGSLEEFKKLGAFKKIRLIRKELRKNNPDEIICFLSNPSVFTYIASLFSKYRRKISFAIRGNPKLDKEKTTTIQKYLIRFVKNVILQNNGQASCYKEKFRNKMVVIPNPIHNNLYVLNKEYSNKPLKIVSVGRLHKQKNYDLAIDAFYLLNQRYPNMQYYIYGKGIMEKELKDKVENYKLSNNVFFMGFENSREKIFLDKDIFLMSSLYEGMPNALAEAMTIGVPSISTDCEFGPSDLIMNERMGTLLKKNDAQLMCDRLENMILNYDEFVKKAIFAKEVLKENYSFEKIIDKWIEFIEKRKGDDINAKN